MKIEQLKEAVVWGNEEVKTGESSPIYHVLVFNIYLNLMSLKFHFKALFFLQLLSVVRSLFSVWRWSDHTLCSSSSSHTSSSPLLLQIRGCSCALRRRASGCSAGPDVTKRSGIKSSVTIVVWGSSWRNVAETCRADWASWRLWGENTSWSSPHTSSPHRRRSKAAGESWPTWLSCITGKVWQCYRR